MSVRDSKNLFTFCSDARTFNLQYFVYRVSQTSDIDPTPLAVVSLITVSGNINACSCTGLSFQLTIDVYGLINRPKASTHWCNINNVSLWYHSAGCGEPWLEAETQGILATRREKVFSDVFSAHSVNFGHFWTAYLMYKDQETFMFIRDVFVFSGITPMRQPTGGTPDCANQVKIKVLALVKVSLTSFSYSYQSSRPRNHLPSSLSSGGLTIVAWWFLARMHVHISGSNRPRYYSISPQLPVPKNRKQRYQLRLPSKRPAYST